MLGWIPSVFAAMFALGPDLLTGTAQPAPIPERSGPAVTLGIDVLLEEQLDLLKGKKLGVLTHPAAVDGQWVPSVDRLVAASKAGGFKVVQLYGPEHGIRGYMTGGEKATDLVDPHTKLPVETLFGLGLKGRPSKASLKRIDLLLVDMQDLGSRTYTYVSTLGEAMEAAQEAKVPVVVLDRPNPYGGLVFEGPVRSKHRKSFIGWGPFPVTHGMTIGEVARFYKEVMGVDVELTVVPMKGWRRSMTWDETGLDWVPTSPAIPHVENAWLYTATGMVGGIAENVSEGVGTTLPFEQVGAEWIDAIQLEKELEARDLPGVRLRAVTYRPASFKFAKKVLHGVHLTVTDPKAFRPIRVALALMTALEKLWPGQALYRDEDEVARVWGTEAVLKAVRAGKSAEAIASTWEKDLAAFAADRARVLLYE